MTPDEHKNEHFHFIGICGTAMGAVAAAMKDRGHEVSGSDQNVYPPMSEFLREREIRVSVGHDPKNVPDDVSLVVIGNAMKTASGRYSPKAVLLGQDDFLPWKRGVSL